MSILHKHRGKHCGHRSDCSYDLGPHCLLMKLQIFEWMTRNIHFVIMRFKG